MIIFTNNRAIRNYTKRLLEQNSKIENLISIAEFNKRAIYIPNFKNINQLEREVIFNEVVKEVKAETVLHIDTTIFNFLSYSRYFFSFFNELSQEGISIDEIQKADYYEDYQKHISILKRIYERYRERMGELKYIDEIFIPLDYELNLPYIKSISHIEFRVEGKLSKFQIALFQEISKYTPVYFRFTRTRFNRGLDNQLEMRFQSGYEYLVDLKKREVLEEKKIEIANNIDVYGFKHKLTQVGFVKERIYYFHEKLGVPLDKIGVVLLDENFSNTLRVFDRKNGKGNLNFSMGESVKDKVIYKFLNGIYLSIENRASQEHSTRIRRMVGDNEELQNIYNFFTENWHRNVLEEFPRYILLTLKQFQLDKSLLKDIINILKLFNSKHLQNLDLRTIFVLFLKEVRKLTIDDVRGGKITVQGLLETRGAEYQAVIVLDFNDDIFPKREEKDFFINSDIRREVKLPLLEDREALQKLYLERVFQKAKYVAISYIDSEETKISRFFYDFDFQQKYIPEYEIELTKIVLSNGEKFSHWSSKGDEVALQYNFQDKPLSNHKMRSFYECPRNFYLSYILNITPHSIDKNLSLLVGNTLHKVLQTVYSQRDSFLDKRELYVAFKNELEKERSLSRMDIASWLQRIDRFIENEIRRFKDGVKVYKVEESVTIENYRGFKLTGKIDRIDILPNGDLMLIDYKTSSLNEFANFFKKNKREKDFQLIFYYILLKEKGENVSLEHLYYYNLSTGELTKNAKTLDDFHSELEFLEKISKEDKINFEKSSKCSQFCNYKTICNTELR